MKWFTVVTDEEAIRLSVKRPLRRRWTAEIPCSSIERVCFQAEGLSMSDGIYVFTSLRPESWVIPTEAVGGDRLWDELIERRLFDASLAVEAMGAVSGVFC